MSITTTPATRRMSANMRNVLGHITYTCAGSPDGTAERNNWNGATVAALVRHGQFAEVPGRPELVQLLAPVRAALAAVRLVGEMVATDTGVTGLVVSSRLLADGTSPVVTVRDAAGQRHDVAPDRVTIAAPAAPSGENLAYVARLTADDVADHRAELAHRLAQLHKARRTLAQDVAATLHHNGHARHQWPAGAEYHVSNREDLVCEVAARVRDHAEVVAAIDAHTAAVSALRSADTIPAPLVGAPVESTDAPSVVWGRIASAGGDTPNTPARRLRVAWVNAALRNVYRLPFLASAGRGVDVEVIAAREADPRDADTRARDYLAAYAAVIDGRAEPVDRLAVAFSAPDDAAQVAAGDRPAVGTRVTVDGCPGYWTIVVRSAEEQRRFPDRIRVQFDGHTFNASTPLDTVHPVGWAAVSLVEYDADPAEGVAEFAVHDAHTGAYVGEVWCNRRGEWRAYRPVYGSSATPGTPTTTGTHTTRAAALAAVDWLDTVPAAQVTPGAVVVLPDGTAATVATVTPADVDGVMLTLITSPDRLDLAAPRPVADNPDTYTAPASALVALAPPCSNCEAPAGTDCASHC